VLLLSSIISAFLTRHLREAYPWPTLGDFIVTCEGMSTLVCYSYVSSPYNVLELSTLLEIRNLFHGLLDTFSCYAI